MHHLRGVKLPAIFPFIFVLILSRFLFGDHKRALFGVDFVFFGTHPLEIAHEVVAFIVIKMADDGSFRTRGRQEIFGDEPVDEKMFVDRPFFEVFCFSFSDVFLFLVQLERNPIDDQDWGVLLKQFAFLFLEVGNFYFQLLKFQLHFFFPGPVEFEPYDGVPFRNRSF